MPVTITSVQNGKILEVTAAEKLTREDYKHLVPEVEKLIQQHGKINILFRMNDFHGWQAGALWEDIKFDWKHFSDIQKLAFVGDRKWEKGMSVFCKPFTTARIRYFDKNQEQQAHEWLESSEAETKPSS